MDQEELPPLVLNSMANDSEEDDSENDDEMDTIEEPTTCLFCKEIAPSVETAMEHIELVHSVSFPKLRQQFQMDQYSFLKLINYIRRENCNAEQIAGAETVFWSDDKYLKPVDYEPWLTYDYEALPINAAIYQAKQHSPSELEALVKHLSQQLQEKVLLLEQAHDDIAKMRTGLQRLFAEKNNSTPDRNKNSLNCVSSTSLKADDSYFSSYAHFGIHHEMLSDVVRTMSYRDALLKNTEFVRGKDVLDVGCGTSVLSIFASQAGAKTVIGIDNSDIIYNAIDIVKKNNIPNVELVKGRLEDTNLPQQKFDIIISEWMGYFLLFEGMLDSVIYARDNHLKDGGMLLPNRCTMSLVGYGNEALYAQHVYFWDDVYGLDMSNMRKEVMHEPLIDIVDPVFVLTESNTIANFDLTTVDLNYSNFAYDLELKCLKDGVLSAFVGYFDTYFDLTTPVMFGTGPHDKPTHWKQVVFFLKEPQVITAGVVVKGKINCHRSRNSARSLDISIEAFGQLHTYYLD